MRPALLAAAAAAALLAFPATPSAEAKPRQVRCVLTAAADRPYRGPCSFIAEKGGSFTVAPPRGRAFFGDVTSISVWIVRPGEADVRGLTTGGINSRWGEAKRSAKDRACWRGSDFSICVY